MPDVMVVNVPPYEGEYEFDMETQPLTTLEWRYLKKISGYLPLTVMDGFQGGDPDLFVAWAVIAMVRAGKVREEDVLTVADQLVRVPFDGTAISFKGAEEESEEANPTTSSPDDEQPSSGASSSESSASTPANVSRLHSGLQVSATGLDSARLTSEA